ncbi:MAG: hypothetical protein ACJ0P8_06795 [Flavobacteriales bacterium]
MKLNDYNDYRDYSVKIYDLSMAMSVLSWDQEINNDAKKWK